MGSPLAGGSVDVAGGSVEVGGGSVGGGLTVGGCDGAEVGGRLVGKVSVGGVRAAPLDGEETAVGDGGMEPHAPTIDATRMTEPGHRIIRRGDCIDPDQPSTNPVLFSRRP